MTNQQYYDTEGLPELYDEQTTVESTNTNHRFSGQLRYEIDKKNNLSFRPKLSFQSNDGTQITFGQSLLGTDILSQTDNHFNADLTALNMSSDLLWRHQFEKKGRTISTRISSSYAPKKGDSFLTSENIFGTTTPDSTMLNQYANLATIYFDKTRCQNFTKIEVLDSLPHFYPLQQYLQEVLPRRQIARLPY